MASLHCLLSQLPEDLPYEYLLPKVAELYQKLPPDKIELESQLIVIQEKKQLQKKDSRTTTTGITRSDRQKRIAKSIIAANSMESTNYIFIVIGICACYFKTQFISATSRFSWNSFNYMTILFHRYIHIGNRFNKCCELKYNMYWLQRT